MREPRPGEGLEFLRCISSCMARGEDCVLGGTEDVYGA